MKITFVGAAKIVTGSCYLIEVGKYKVLIDCGMFQGRKETTRLNYKPFPFNPKQITHVFLTHAHIDHSGLLPKLVKEGFSGKIHSTEATADLCKIMLEDSAHIQEMETKYENERRIKKNQPARSQLYTQDDVVSTISLFSPFNENQIYDVNKNIKVRYQDAGHIIGSSIIEMFITEGNEKKKLVFSGDLGQWDVPIVKDPTLIKDADYIFLESTYGSRLHEEVKNRADLLLEYVTEAYENGGKLLIPSFAIERTQELLYSFHKLIQKGKFPRDMKIYLDSPLAIKATEIFKQHPEFFDKDALTRFKDPFTMHNLEYTPNAQDSMKLNNLKGPCVIIAGSGMATAGRIRHHIKYHINKPSTILLFVGYQAEGTLGRVLLEGAKRIKMMGKQFDVNAKIAKINSFSAHADYNDILKWMKGFSKKPTKIFLVHGEEESSKALKEKLSEYDCYIPELRETIKL